MIGPKIIPASPAIWKTAITLPPLPLMMSPTMLAGHFSHHWR
jgi:hypothetical protein